MNRNKINGIWGAFSAERSTERSAKSVPFVQWPFLRKALTERSERHAGKVQASSGKQSRRSDADHAKQEFKLAHPATRPPASALSPLSAISRSNVLAVVLRVDRAIRDLGRERRIVETRKFRKGPGRRR
jgi:hypothetical protein